MANGAKLKPTRTQLARRATATKRRAKVLANGGRALYLLLDAEAARALQQRMDRNQQSALDVVSKLLIAK